MNIKIEPRKSTDRGGYICMPQKRNSPNGRDGWEEVKCPICKESCWRRPEVDMLIQTQGCIAICTMCALRKGCENDNRGCNQKDSV